MRLNSIKTKLLLLLIFIAMLAIVLVSTALIIHEKNSANTILIEELTSIADIVALNSGAALAFNDCKVARDTLRTLTARKGIVAACLYDADLHLFAEYSVRNFNVKQMNADFNKVTLDRQASLLLLKKQGYLTWFCPSKHYIHVVRPVRLSGEVIGAIHLVSNTLQIRERLESYYKVISGIIALTLGIVFLLSIWMQKLFTVPLLDLMQSINFISRSKNYSVRVENKNNDEFGSLIDRFNDMLGEIQDRDKELHEYGRGLEKMVKLRTAELSEANKNLELMVLDLGEARDAAEAGSRAKSEFLATMSHEIRTPMNGVMGMTELLLESGLNDRQERFTRTIHRSSVSLLSIINDILDFSKIEAGKLELENHNFNLQILIEDIGEMFAERAHNKNLELIPMPPSRTHKTLRGDCIRLRQVLVNLVGNAIKFTETGEVVFKAEEIGCHEEMIIYRFVVKDTGIGIHEKAAAQIFDSFSQADSSTTRKYGGSGLGLAISQRLVGLMGGEIEVASEVDKGTEFSFTVLFEMVTEKLPSNDTPREILLGLRTLIVDDNTTNRAILNDQVSAFGMTCSVAETSKQALKILLAAASDGKPYDLALLDWHMQEMNGIELTKRIRAEESLTDISLVMLSSATFDEESLKAAHAGIDLYLTKPVRYQVLFKSLVKLMGNLTTADMEAKTIPPETKSVSFSGTVLVAEDNVVNQDVAREMLLSLGCQAKIVENGRQAVNVVKTRRFDLVLMDCHMPEMDGFNAARQIRLNEKMEGVENGVPIIALTSDVRMGIREQCRKQGMNDYMSKPFSRGELEIILRQWLVFSEEKRVIDSSFQKQKPENSKKTSDTDFVLDRKRLDVIRALQSPERRNVLDRIIGLYQENSPALVCSIRNAVAEKNSNALMEAAHSLKSSSANLGATHFASMCKKLEDMGRDEQIDGAEELFKHVESEFQKVVVLLSAELENTADRE